VKKRQHQHSYPAIRAQSKKIACSPATVLTEVWEVYIGERADKQNLTGLFTNTLQEIEQIRRQDIFRQYVLWKDSFTAD